MGDGSSLRISVEQGLPLQVQYFNNFCVPKVLIEKPAHTDPSLTRSEKITAASGPLAKALALRVTCILKAATQAG